MCPITFRDLCCKVCWVSMTSLPEKTTYCRRAKRGVSNEGSPGVYKEPCHLIEYATQPHYEGFCSGQGFCSRPQVRFNGLLDMTPNRSGTEDQVRSPEMQQQDTVMQSPSNMGHPDDYQAYYLPCLGGAHMRPHPELLHPLPLHLALRMAPQQAPIGTGRPRAAQQTIDEKDLDQKQQNCVWQQDPFSVQQDPKTPAEDCREDDNSITQQQTPNETDFRDAEACFRHGSSLEYNQRGVFHQRLARKAFPVPAGPSGFYGSDGVRHFW